MVVSLKCTSHLTSCKQIVQLQLSTSTLLWAQAVIFFFFCFFLFFFSFLRDKEEIHNFWRSLCPMPLLCTYIICLLMSHLVFLNNHWPVPYFLLLQVCLEKMQDLQLALVISRLYESEFETSSTYKKILQRHVLGQDKQVHRGCVCHSLHKLLFLLWKMQCFIKIPSVWLQHDDN